MATLTPGHISPPPGCVTHRHQQAGPARVPTLLAELDDRALGDELARQGALRSRWYPFEALANLMERAAPDLGSEGLFEFGRFIAHEDLTTVNKIMLMVAPPTKLADRFTQSYSLYFDAGVAVVTGRTPSSFSFEIRDFPTPHPLHCEIIRGFVAGALELSRVRPKLVHPACRCRGDAACRFDATWS